MNTNANGITEMIARIPRIPHCYGIVPEGEARYDCALVVPNTLARRHDAAADALRYVLEILQAETDIEPAARIDWHGAAVWCCEDAPYSVLLAHHTVHALRRVLLDVDADKDGDDVLDLARRALPIVIVDAITGVVIWREDCAGDDDDLPMNAGAPLIIGLGSVADAGAYTPVTLVAPCCGEALRYYDAAELAAADEEDEA